MNAGVVDPNRRLQCGFLLRLAEGQEAAYVGHKGIQVVHVVDGGVVEQDLDLLEHGVDHVVDRTPWFSSQNLSVVDAGYLQVDDKVNLADVHPLFTGARHNEFDNQ